MRGVLPAMVPRADAVANLGRVAVAVAGLAGGRLDALRLLRGDRLHEPYRAAVYPELPVLIEAALGAGALGACLAGAGSTVVAFADGDLAADRVLAALRGAAGAVGLGGRGVRLAVRPEGARTTVGALP